MAKENEKAITNREVKNSAFTTFFGEPENASRLYAALGEEEVSPDDITYVTLEGVLFIARKNDLAFTVKNRVLVISEHQSTINENMPLRDLLYLGRTMEKLLDERAIYKRKLFQIPTPEFYVFYNGDETCPTEKILRLSDAFLEKTEHPMVELEVKVININLPSGHKLLRECRPMYEYSWFIQRIKEYLGAGWVRDAAIVQATKDCVEEGILTEFMKEHGSEVLNMLNTQWNYDDAVAVEREEAFEEGRESGLAMGKTLGILEGKAAGIAEGKAAGIAEGKAVGIAEGKVAAQRQVIYAFLEQLGEIPEDIRIRIESEQDGSVLKKWYMLAPGVKSFEAFREHMEKGQQ